MNLDRVDHGYTDPSKLELTVGSVSPEPSPELQLLVDLSLSESTRFLDVEIKTTLRKRLLPTALFSMENTSDSALLQSTSDEHGIKDMSLTARTPEQAEHIVREVLEEAETSEQLVRKLWDGAWKVCHFNSLPRWLQDNNYLLKGHRPPLRSYSDCFLSIFRIHTETVNIWTHLLGCLLFVGIAVHFLSRPSDIPWNEKAIISTFFASVVSCLGMSSISHIVSCHSKHVGKLFSKLDYCGIAILITGSFVPWIYYSFYCDYWRKIFYFVLVSVLGAASMIVSMWDKFSEPQFRCLRAAVFAGFGLSGVVPAMHYLIVDGFFEAVYHGSFGWLCLVAILYLLGAAFYALRVPERFFPGKCDIWCQSHQIFHVLVITAAVVFYHGLSEMAFHKLSMGTCKYNP